VQVRSISVLGKNLVVGLHTGQIYVVNDFETSKDIGPALVYGHFDGELWAGTWAPDGTFVTAVSARFTAVWRVPNLRHAGRGQHGGRVGCQQARDAQTGACAGRSCCHPREPAPMHARTQSTVCGEDIRGDPLKRPPMKKLNTKASSTTAYPPEQCARGISVSPDGAHVAVGTNAGMVRHPRPLQALTRSRPRTCSCSCMTSRH
jgi:hypothetical protein